MSGDFFMSLTLYFRQIGGWMGLLLCHHHGGLAIFDGLECLGLVGAKHLEERNIKAPTIIEIRQFSMSMLPKLLLTVIIIFPSTIFLTCSEIGLIDGCNLPKFSCYIIRYGPNP
ncbi:hypothetical protein ACJX0J_017527, partial [Zea mays]